MTESNVENNVEPQRKPFYISKKSERYSKLAENRKGPVDGRTLRKIRRYRQELRSGIIRGQRKLLPFEIVVRVNALMEHGDNPEEIKKLIRRRKCYEYNENKMIALLKEMQPVCKFYPEAYELAGIRRETLEAAGIVMIAA